MKKIFILAAVIAALIATDAFCVDIDAMVPLLEKAKKNIKETFASIDGALSAAARELSAVDLKREKARGILSGLCKDRPYMIDCAIVDTAGKMIAVEPEEYRKYEGSDISNQAHIIALHRDKKPVFSNVFRSVEGVESIDFEYPIFSDKNEFLGSISMLVKQDALCDDIVTPLVKDVPCKIWIMQKDGLVIYDPDPDQIGKNVFTDELFKPFQDLVAFCGTVAMAKDGAGSYDFYAKGLEDKTIVKKYAVWDTASLYGTEWRIIVMEADKPVSGAKDTAVIGGEAHLST
ncbi:MAG: cache domain-containing protein [Candidatus Omnitrophica bacterium]|nr:cache domain-containing protein [Candidatus Omnitrophota bacterium]